MPATHLFDGVETEGEVAEGDPQETPPLGGDRLGLGAPRGVTKAVLRVVEDVAGLDRLEPGEILVAQNIDPAWTGVFPILGVPQATSRFATGMRVELDGTRGSVRVERADG